MLNKLLEYVLPYIIGVYHNMEKLSKKEKEVQTEFIQSVKTHPSNKKPIVIAMIGLVGSGKSTVASMIAKQLPATIISGDTIRILLRNKKEKYEKTRAIAENVMMYVLEQNGNVVLDSDFIDPKKRASLREKVRKVNGKLVFVRTYADIDVVSQRIRTQKHAGDSFFGGASSASTAQDSGPDVKFREMWRRTPHHYKWINEDGGKWVLKKLPFSIFTTIDTSGSEKTVESVSKAVYKLKKCN